MSESKIRRAYGLWSSPVTARSLARGGKLNELAWSEDGDLLWLEERSDSNVVVLQPADGQAARDLNSDFSMRGRVGYGGGSFTVGHGQVFFIDASSGRIYRQPLPAGQARPLVPSFGMSAAPTLSPDGRWLVFVHTYEGQDSLAITDTEGKYWPQILVSGDDFYMQPAWHPDGTRVAWVAWEHPNMPWDGTYLRLGRLEFCQNGLPFLAESFSIAGDSETSIYQPQFSPDGRRLAFVSDASGWWQIYLYDLESGETRQLTNALAEHGEPAWQQGGRMYDFAPSGKRLYFLRNRSGFMSLWEMDLGSGAERHLSLPDYTYLDKVSISPDGRKAALLASSADIPPRVITCELGVGDQPAQVHVWRRAYDEDVPRALYATPEVIEWRSEVGSPVYGLYYPPNHPNFEGIGKPPLVVYVHGGPTSQNQPRFRPQVQFFTTRGYGVLEVNYRGSTGYGRAYRNLLRGNWGLYDAQDSISGAQYLVDAGRADPERLVILGGSAGGYTVLRALQERSGFFRAGVVLYGIANQFSLAAETHKFEAHYSDRLLGSLPEAAQVYRERSPIFAVDRLQDPLAIFQGEDDRVVPRSQSDELVASLARRGVAHIYHVYAGEGHGFRKAETLEHYYKTVDEFLRQYVIYA